jgi:hypothetical protein
MGNSSSSIFRYSAVYLPTGGFMPKRRTHLAVGATAGVALSALNSLDQNAFDLVLEVLGGWCGGRAGAALPDILDRPIHPGHRAIAHGVVPVGTALALWIKNLEPLQDNLRGLANRHRAQRISAQDPLEALGHLLAEWIFRFLAGLVAGFGAGYISHIILDFGTPGCIPLVM